MIHVNKILRILIALPAILFMVTSLTLAYLSSHRTGDQSIVTDTPAPVQTQAAPGTTTPPAPGSGETQPAKTTE